MSLKTGIVGALSAASSAVVAIGVVCTTPAPAWAIGGGAGCADLPLHDRATGALEGMTGACDMSVDEARRILAQDAPRPAVQPDGAPLPRHRRVRHRHHRG